MKNTKPRVSIGLPVYNGERFLEQTLESHLTQTYSDFELIISDNASIDQTEGICCSYAMRDSRIRYFRNRENIGLGRNFNRVFQLSSGEYFKWANADDLCKREYLARCVDLLDTDPTVVLTYARTTFIDENGNVLDRRDRGWDLRADDPEERFRYVLFSGHYVNSLYGLIRSSALSNTRLMASYPGGDYRILGELSLLGKFYEIPEYLFLRRLHAGASSHDFSNNERLMEFFQLGSARITLSQWNSNLDHFITIIRSDLSVHNKLSLTIALLRRMYWGRSQLLKALTSAAGVYFRVR